MQNGAQSPRGKVMFTLGSNSFGHPAMISVSNLGFRIETYRAKRRLFCSIQ
jgi:hypothetical protein